MAVAHVKLFLLARKTREAVISTKKVDPGLTNLDPYSDDFLSLIGNLNCGIFIVDNLDKIRFVNFQLTRLLKIKRETLIGESYKLLFSNIISKCSEPAVLQKSLDRAMENISNQPAIHFSMDLDSRRYFQLLLAPIDDYGEKSDWGGLLIETSLLQEEVRWKGAVLSEIVREIRSALATLKGLASALDENFNQWTDEMVADFLMEINKKIDSLTLVVDQTLTFSQVDVGEMGLHPVGTTISKLVEGSLHKISPIMDISRVAIDLPENLPHIRVDINRVEEVLAYFVQSGLEASSQDKTLEISADRDKSKVNITIYIPGGESLDNEFLEFIRTNGHEDEKPGSSHLAYQHAVQVIEAHGGTLNAKFNNEKVNDIRINISFPSLPDFYSTEPDEEGRVVPISTFGHILIVEKEPDYQAIFSTVLEEAGFRIDISTSGQNAVEILDSTSIDLVLISDKLEDVHGINLLQTIRRYSNIPILFIGDGMDNSLLVEALEMGADDFITKPINSSELIARIKSHLRRKTEHYEIDPDANRFTINGLTIDLETHQVWKSGKEIELTMKEFDILGLLAQNRGRVLTYQNIIESLWEPGKGSRHALSVHISRLRQKIETDPQNPKLVLTKWGSGYYIKAG